MRALPSIIRRLASSLSMRGMDEAKVSAFGSAHLGLEIRAVS
jgi:hypothetical protein